MAASVALELGPRAQEIWDRSYTISKENNQFWDLIQGLHLLNASLVLQSLGDLVILRVFGHYLEVKPLGSFGSPTTTKSSQTQFGLRVISNRHLGKPSWTWDVQHISKPRMKLFNIPTERIGAWPSSSSYGSNLLFWLVGEMIKRFFGIELGLLSALSFSF